MDNLVRWSILLELISELKNAGSWCGETHIQKSAFFLEEMLDVPLDLGFIMYKYGPYSFELSDDLTALRAYNYINLMPQPYGVTYSLQNEENKLKKFYEKEIEKYLDQISSVAETFGNKTVVELEKLATAFFIYNNENIEDAEEIAKRLNEIKPHVSIQDAERAVGEMLEIKNTISD
jgi:uncharacterized protein YwgA